MLKNILLAVLAGVCVVSITWAAKMHDGKVEIERKIVKEEQQRNWKHASITNEEDWRRAKIIYREMIDRTVKRDSKIQNEIRAGRTDFSGWNLNNSDDFLIVPDDSTKVYNFTNAEMHGAKLPPQVAESAIFTNVVTDMVDVYGVSTYSPTTLWLYGTVPEFRKELGQ